PAWSPDGQKIAFSSFVNSDFQIYVMNADGSNPILLTNNAPGQNKEPTWSPDGQKIAFTSTRDGNQEIYVMNADGSNQTPITNNPANDSQAAWSPFVRP
ncbi:TolB family protein, partial [Bacillus toyonensis]